MRKRRGTSRGVGISLQDSETYELLPAELTPLETLLYMVRTFDPSTVTAPMITRAMSEAISAYSIAVAPDPHWVKRRIRLVILLSAESGQEQTTRAELFHQKSAMRV